MSKAVGTAKKPQGRAPWAQAAIDLTTEGYNWAFAKPLDAIDLGFFLTKALKAFESNK